MGDFRSDLPLGTADAEVFLKGNVPNLDEAVNTRSAESWNDRFGVARKTWHGMEQEFDSDQSRRENEFESAQTYRESRFNDFIASSGYQFLGDYAAGIEITEYNQIVRDSNGEFWRLSGQVELPYTTTGDWGEEEGLFVAVGDAALRADLAMENGVSLVGGAVPESSSHRGTVKLDLNAIDVFSSRHDSIIESVIDGGIVIVDKDNRTASTTIDIKEPVSIFGNQKEDLNVGKNTILFDIDGAHGSTFKSLKVVGASSNNDASSAIAFNTQNENIEKPSNLSFYDISARDITVAFNIDTASNTKIIGGLLKDLVQIPSLGIGGYGVLTQDAKSISIAFTDFIAGIDSRHATYLSTRGMSSTDNARIIGTYSDWSKTAGSSNTGKVTHVTRAVQGLSFSSNISRGGTGGFTSRPTSADSHDVVINGNIFKSIKTDGVDSGPAIRFGADPNKENKTKNVVISNNITEISKSASAQQGSDAVFVFEDVDNIIISNHISENEEGVFASFKNCHNVIIDNIIDNNDKKTYPLIYFEHNCSNFTLGNIKTGRPILYDGILNITDMTCNFHRQASISLSGGVEQISDQYLMIETVSRETDRINVKFRNHVTNSAVKAIQITAKGGGFYAYSLPLLDREIDIYVEKSDGSLINPQTADFLVVIHLYS